MDQPSVKKNYMYRLLYELLALVTPFITTPYVSRILGADGVGIYSYTSSIIAYFVMFAGLGTATYGAREIAQNRDDPYAASKIFYEIELMSVATSAIAIAAWMVVIAVSDEYRYYFMALTPMLFGSMFNISWYFTGYEKIRYTVARDVICKIAGILLLFLLVREKEDLIIYVLINSFLSLFGSLSMWTYLPKMLVRVDFKSLRIRRHLKETLVYFIPSVATSVYTVLDKTLIGVITQDSYENGYYEQATKVINVVKSAVFAALNAVMESRMSYLFKLERYDEIRERISRSMNFIFLLGIGAVFGIIGVAEEFVPVFFGAGYEPVVQLLQLMSPLIVIIGISNCLGSQYYTPAGLRAKSARYIILGSCVNLVLNLCLIPQFGAQGAVIASIAAELAITVLYVANSGNFITVRLLASQSCKKLVAGFVMFLFVRCASNMDISNTVFALSIEVCIGILVYFLILLLLRDDMLLQMIDIGRKTLRNRFQ